MNDLIRERIQSIKANSELKAVKASDDHRNRQAELSAIAVQETILKAFSSLVKYLDNHTSKTEVINQLKDIGTPDAMKVVSAVDDLHDTLKTHKNTDLSEVTSVMKQVLAETKAIPKDHPTIDIPSEVTVKNQTDNTKDLKALLDAVKAIKLVAEAPVVNIPAPEVNVQAPDLKPVDKGLKAVEKAVKSLVFPEYKTDNTEVEKLLKKANKTLNDIYSKPVGGGGGGGRVSPYENSDKQPMFVELTPAGAIPVDIQDTSITITQAVPTTLIAFITTVTTAGTRVQLASNAGSGFILQAPSTNTGNIYIGGSTVSSSIYGSELQPGQSASVALDNTNKIYIDASASGDKLAVMGS